MVSGVGGKWCTAEGGGEMGGGGGGGGGGRWEIGSGGGGEGDNCLSGLILQYYQVQGVNPSS